MKDSKMPFYYSNQRLIALLIVGVLLYAVVIGIVRARTANMVALITESLDTQRNTLVTLAEFSTKNDVDEVTKSLIKDCQLAERVEFDDLLSRLDTRLSMAELARLDRLFGRCGGYYSERKAVLVARLEREVAALAEYQRLLALIISANEEQEEIALWQDFIVSEKTQSQLFSELVTLQDTIITNLLAGKQPDSAEIKVVLERVRTAQSDLIVARDQSQNILSTLTNL